VDVLVLAEMLTCEYVSKKAFMNESKNREKADNARSTRGYASSNFAPGALPEPSRSFPGLFSDSPVDRF
jgi:hypothetical protein